MKNKSTCARNETTPGNVQQPIITQRRPWVPRLDVDDMKAAAENPTEKADLRQLDSLHFLFDRDNCPDAPTVRHSLCLTGSLTWSHRQVHQELERGEQNSASAKLQPVKGPSRSVL